MLLFKDLLSIEDTVPHFQFLTETCLGCADWQNKAIGSLVLKVHVFP